MNDVWAKIKSWFSDHKWACICGVVGVLYVLLWFEIGFWRTILLTIAAAICVFIGSLIDGHAKNKDED